MNDPTTAETPTMRERLARNMARRYYDTEEPPFPGSEDQFVEMHWPAFAEELDDIFAELEAAGYVIAKLEGKIS